MQERAGGRWKWPLARVLRKALPAMPLVAALGLLASVLEGAGIGLLIPLLSVLLADSGGAGTLPAPLQAVVRTLDGFDPETRAAALGGAIFGLILLKGIVQGANEWLAASIEGAIGQEIRNRLARTLVRLDYSFFLKQNNARLSHIVATDSWFVQDAVHSALTLIPAAAGLLVFCVLLAWLNLYLFLFVLVGAAGIQVVLGLFERRQKNLSYEFTERSQRLWDRMLTMIQTPRVVRLFGQQDRETERASAAIRRLRQTIQATRITRAFAHPIMDAMIALLFIVVLIAGYRSGMSLPAITAFLLLLTRAQPHARTITAARWGVVSLRGSLQEVAWLLAQEPAEPSLPPARVKDVRFDRPIVFKDVSYAYPDGSPALEHVTVTIRPGVATAIIGESGSGKTTMINLLCGLIVPQFGRICLGDEPMEAIDPQNWRRRIAVAGQDPELVSGTVFENIAYGHEEASVPEVKDAARAAGADRFIAGLPQGYDTMLGPNGLNLSGGERQRVALARALLTRPDLLILDEATSAVDAIAESEIMRLIAEHRFFDTILIISHRKTTIAACDDGIVLEDGRVVEAGPLAELGYFRGMAGSANARNRANG